MNCFYVFAFIAEIWGVMFLVWGAFHQNRLIAFERKIGKAVKNAKARH